ncbi:MAG: helix-turn-helix domain-containing protein, partial [Gemmatimonadota bacterium]|nr:helix-turn-helix domain-containing protein [Gemmatimonadota bacterium]
VPPTAAAVHALLWRFQHAGREAYPSQAWIAEKLGTNRTTIARAVAQLEKAGLLQKTGRSGRSSVYIAMTPDANVGRTGTHPAPNSPPDTTHHGQHSGKGCTRMRQGVSQNETHKKEGKSSSTVVLEAPPRREARQRQRRRIIAAFTNARRRTIGDPRYRITPQDNREVTEAIKLGTFDGITDLDATLDATLRWLQHRRLATTLRATVNNLANGEAAMHGSADTASPPGGVTDIDAFRRELTLADEPAPPQNTAGEKEGTP